MAAYRRGRGSLFYQPEFKHDLLWEFWSWNRNPYIVCDLNGGLDVKLMDGAFDAEGQIDPCEIVLISGSVIYHDRLPPCPTRETLNHPVSLRMDRIVNILDETALPRAELEVLTGVLADGDLETLDPTAHLVAARQLLGAGH